MEACGCFSPPIPKPTQVDFAVNQHAEQIIFEVEPDGHVVAHVLIRYSGAPEQFAWIVPVPSVPELQLSYAEAFGLIDDQTSPKVSISRAELCPPANYACRKHPPPSCGHTAASGSAGVTAGGASAPTAGAGASSPNTAAPSAPPVTVYARQQVGSYDTIVFGAGDAAGAVDWLQKEGFIVNDTMGPYMQPYLDEKMLFVAAKLVPGAGVDAIRPLRMRYVGTQPMIPLRITAVATEPNLTVTAYIYGAGGFGPIDGALLRSGDIPEDALSATGTRNNYPMVLARLFDEEGGRAYMLEYSGAPPKFQPATYNTNVTQFPGGFPSGAVVGGSGSCCDAMPAGAFGTGLVDPCRILNDGQCQCPLSPAEANDCASKPDLVAGVQLVEDLSKKYARMTRITTRLSAEEMTFDPTFAPDASVALTQRLAFAAEDRVFGSACQGDILEPQRATELTALRACATVYCGRGKCAASASGAGCVCPAGEVARMYSDLDDLPSVTCVPEKAPVDLAAGGIDVPNVCDTLPTQTASVCVNLAGFAGVRCGSGEVAVVMGSALAPSCEKVTFDSATSGARDYSAPLADVRVCAPRPPPCDAAYGWLEPTNVKQRASVEDCPSSTPDPSWLVKPPAPTCSPSTTLGTFATLAGSADNGATSATTAAPRPMMQLDTTQPRMSMSRHAGCSLSARSADGRSAQLVWAAIGALWLARRRARARGEPRS